ncbi:hypothetical protein LJR220_000081 [Bradyrhizobium sp. LjRoot220]|uniref:hypothetical protein n=1 Tax=Bradyrhizobium sp. LjRoot220 TaxID=3342284 RepID=UPI003ED163C3
MGGWIETGTKGREAPSIAGDRRANGVWAHTKHLKNLYVYFWRWATWKVFRFWASCIDRLGGQRRRIVCFITVAGFLNGPGFEKMRDDLRRTCSRYGSSIARQRTQPEVATRIFQGVQQPICIVLAARKLARIYAGAAGSAFPGVTEG